MAEEPRADPYGNCERHCSHDLGPGVLISELLGADGPHPPGYLLVNLAHRGEPVLPELARALAAAPR